MSVQTSYAMAPAVGFAGLVVENKSTHSMYNAEASSDMNAPVPVKFGTTNQAALLPSAIADQIAGIAVHGHSIAMGVEFSAATGFEPGAMMNVLRQGKLWVTVIGAVNPGDRLHVKIVGGFGFRASQDGVNTRDCTTQGQFLTAAADGGLALLEVNFLAE